MIWCAGSLANAYSELGGNTLVAGKPNKPIYDLALATLGEIIGHEADKGSIVAIGDGMPTDVAGAINNGFDLIYISAGIHNAHYGPAENPDEYALQEYLASHNVNPNFWMPRLSWSTT